MSEVKFSIRNYKRQTNVFPNSRMTLAKCKSIGPYEIYDFLKEGSSSKIYLARSKYTNENVAIKAINKTPLQNDLDELLLITKQIETLKVLKHRNIVTLYEIYESKKYIYLVTEYLPGKDVIEKLIKKKRFSEDESLRIFFQLLDALTYMHKNNICHRNLRTEHILFDENNRPKIVGFGFSSFYESNKLIEGAYGSLCYACPEIIDETSYNPELADVWSLGVILYVLICGYLPFSDEDDNKNKILISKGKIDFPKEISNKLKDLLRHMLDINPQKRYTFQKILKHPWIKPYSEKILSQGINIHKIIYPVDERILNIIKEYGLDKNKVKNDLIMNKYNIGTGLYKQIVRVLLDLKIKNISDLWSEEFIAYRDDVKNKIDDGDQKYYEYIEQIDDKYRKKEDFINDFKAREDSIAERLIYLKEKKEELNVIKEQFDDEQGKNSITISDNENDNKKDTTHNNIATIKTKKKILPRTKTPLFNFGEKARETNYGTNNTNNNNMNNLLLNNDDDEIQIVYNNEKEVDIIKQFQEEQNQKLYENLIIEKPSIKRTISTPNLVKEKNTNNPPVINSTETFKISIKQKENLVQKILERKSQKNNYTTKYTGLYSNSIKTINTKTSLYSNINTKNTLFGNINTKNSLFSNINTKDTFVNNLNNLNNIYCGNVNNNSNEFKSLLSGNQLYTFNSNSNNNAKSLFRMTISKTNTKSHLSRGSLYDNYLKKNHPDNIRKTIFQKNKISGIIKENDESESENENENKSDEEIREDEEEEKEDKDELKQSYKLKYSLSFDDDDDDDENEENEDDMFLNNKEEDLKLFLDDENDEEMKELKKIYFNEQRLNKNF